MPLHRRTEEQAVVRPYTGILRSDAKERTIGIQIQEMNLKILMLNSGSQTEKQHMLCDSIHMKVWKVYSNLQ